MTGGGARHAVSCSLSRHDQDIDAVLGPEQFLGQAPDLLQRGEVSPVGADRRVERRRNRVEALLAAAVEQQGMPLACECPGDAAAEAVGRAGDQNGFRAHWPAHATRTARASMCWRTKKLRAAGVDSGVMPRAVTDGTSSALTAM